MKLPTYDHIFIAVHGIGDQMRSATIRSVATRFASSTALVPPGQSAPLAPQPLGFFHSEVSDAVHVCPLDELDDLSGPLARTGFAEVYWADIPRKANEERFTLEESKAWGRTVVARARAVFKRAAKQVRKGDLRLETPDFTLAVEVFEEIIETIYVVENLLYLGSKAGLPKFELRKLLDEYLGDVQIVTEFTYYRRDIVGRFHRAMQDIRDADEKAKRQEAQETGQPQKPPAKLHIVAHSEGTVVSFLGLLHALSAEHLIPAKPDADEGPDLEEGVVPEWLQHVHGYMTIGSPIDKHLLLWPSLWLRFDLSKTAKLFSAQHQIHWRNYYDYGDPVGFKLDTARQFLARKNDVAFEFTKEHDHGFARYVLPGKAHNDYWEDPQVFDHFIRDVVSPGSPPLPVGFFRRLISRLRRVPIQDPPPPRTRPHVWFFSPLIPYFLATVVLFLGSFIFYKAVAAYMNPELDPLQRYMHFTMVGGTVVKGIDRSEILRNAVGVAALLAGVTMLSRLPRLARGPVGWLTGSAGFAVGAFLYWRVIDGPARTEIGKVFGASEDAATLGVIASALIVAIIGWVGLWKPTRANMAGVAERQARWFLRGMRPLILCGAVAVLVIVGYQMRHPRPVLTQEEEARLPAAQRDQIKELLTARTPVWPILVAGGLFLYLWWLAALVFDLAFVWHRYIRNSVAIDRLHGWSERALSSAASKANVEVAKDQEAQEMS